MNTQILKDPEFVKEIENAVGIHNLNANVENILDSWDKLKERIKEIAVQISIKRSKEKKDNHDQLSQELKQVKKR